MSEDTLAVIDALKQEGDHLQAAFADDPKALADLKLAEMVLGLAAQLELLNQRVKFLESSSPQA